MGYFKRILALTLSAALLLPVVTSCKDRSAEIAENPYATAAHDLILNIIEDYYDREDHDLHTERGGDGNAFVWPFGSFLEALSDTYELFPEDETIRSTYIDALTNGIAKYRVKGKVTTPTGEFSDIVYYNASVGNRGDFYYDDNAWICLQFLRAYDLLGDETYLEKAEELLTFFETGWDDVLGGGIYWDKTYTSKNTCADGPIAICYFLAYQKTKNEHYLDMGKKILDWMNETLREDDLYIDNVNIKGESNTWKADYNQGTPLYALCLAAEITGEKDYRTMADATALAARNNAFRYRPQNGHAFINGNPIYKAWCVGWLMRGFEEYARLTGSDAEGFVCMEYVLDQKTIGKADGDGYYDPYFGTDDWSGENTTEALQACGVCSVLAVCAHYDVYVK